MNNCCQSLSLISKSVSKLRSYSLFLPATLTVLSFGLDTNKALAQTSYPFQAIYDVVVKSEPITSEVSKITLEGKSGDAPYGLTNIISLSYTRLDPTTGVTTAGPDAAEFGLQGLPILTDKFFGSGDDSLIGTSRATAVADLQNLTASASGIVTVTDGTGRFSGAKGTLSILDKYTLSPDPTAPIRGQAFVDGSFQTFQKVPEPSITASFISISAIGACFLRGRKHRKAVL